MAADLAAFLAKEGYQLIVIGMPKTIDNDVYPITQTLGAWTAAEQGARYFSNVVAEATSNPRMLIVHEVMGRDCGWLTAATAAKYRDSLSQLEFSAALGVSQERLGVHAVYLPEMKLDLEATARMARTQANVAVAEYQLAQAAAKREREAAAQKSELQDNIEEIQSNLGSDTLTESPAVGRSCAE